MFNDDKSQWKSIYKIRLCSAIWSHWPVERKECKKKSKLEVNENKETNEQQMCIVHISKSRNQ